jgi:hypothetical protein
MSKTLENVKLSPREILVANASDVTAGQIGYNPNVKLLSQILKGVSQQVYPIIRVSNYMPVLVGEGAWSTELIKMQAYSTGDGFRSGVINLAENNSRLADMGSAFGTANFKIWTWAKTITWSLPQLEQAAKTGEYSIIEQAEISRKTNWNLGIQETAFIGDSVLGIPGLLVSGTSPVNKSIIPAGKKIGELAPEQFNAVAASFIAYYSDAVNYTVFPDRFLVPADDYNLMASATSPQFPIISKLEYLERQFRQQTMNSEFKILPTFYAMPKYSLLAKPRYALYRSDVNSLACYIPADYTPTMANTVNGFQLQNVAYGQFCGCCIIRPAELQYFEPADA